MNPHHLYAISYLDGLLAVYPRNGTCLAEPQIIRYSGSGPKGTKGSRQQSAHAHQAVISPDGRFLYVGDLGTDSVYRHEISANSRKHLMKKLLLLAFCTLAALSGWAAEAQPLVPQVSFTAAPLKPTAPWADGPSVVLDHPAHHSGGADAATIHEPLREGGFRIRGSGHRLNRYIVQGQNRLWTGDPPFFQLDSFVTDNQPTPALWEKAPLSTLPAKNRKAMSDINLRCSLGSLRLGVPGAAGRVQWLDELGKATTTTFWPGHTDYEIVGPGWKATVRIAPTMGQHGLVCEARFDRPTPLLWQYGNIYFTEDAPRIQLTLKDGAARFTDAHRTNAVVIAGWDGQGKVRQMAGSTTFGLRWSGEGKEYETDSPAAEFQADKPRQVYHIFSTWGVTELDRKMVAQSRDNLMVSGAAKAWPAEAEKLWQSWMDCYVNPALDPEGHFRTLSGDPGAALARSLGAWDKRRDEFQIRTPDEHLDALMNWARAVSDYHKQGPGLYLGTLWWTRYAHISCGWNGKSWGGDHATMEQQLRLYACTQVPAFSAMTRNSNNREQPYVPGAPLNGGKPFNNWHLGGGEIITGEGGYIGYFMPDLTTWFKEDNTAFWVEQVWNHYRWTGNKQFARDLWPMVKKAVSWERRNHDADGDGIFTSFYPYWNADSMAVPAKSAVATATAYGMLQAAVGLGEAVGDPAGTAEYRALAEKTRAAAECQLWNEKAGVLASIGADGLSYSHPHSWEETLAISMGLLDPERGRRAMRWVESRYGLQGVRPEVRLLLTDDLWPILWSGHWAPVGDTLLSAMAGLKCGDADLWWPYLRTAVYSAFRGATPGIRFGLNNYGVAAGDMKDVDADDSHAHMAVRGLFGIEPALHKGEIAICPAFPANWKEASIKTPDLSYEYRCEGDAATIRIRTPQPLVKRVRANLTGPETVTGSERESVVKVKVGPALPPTPPQAQPPSIVVEKEKAPKAPARLPDTELARLRLVDLSKAYNIRAEELTETPMLFDNRQTPMPVSKWWYNPPLAMPATPQTIEAGNGVRFLVAGRPVDVAADTAPKGLVALSSWRPYPWPAGVTIPIGKKCEKVWLLLQNYVHPSKCYVPNGEVILHYADKKTATTSLIPPYNLDCYYQHFSREGILMPLGQYNLKNAPDTAKVCHADALAIPADPSRMLESVEVRATCSEGIIGLAGMSVLVTQHRGGNKNSSAATN